MMQMADFEKRFRPRGWFEEYGNTHMLSAGIGTRNMLEVTPLAGRHPSKFADWGTIFPHIAQSIRTKKYSYKQVSGLVSKDPQLQRAITQAAEQIVREQRLEERLKNSLSEISAADADADINSKEDAKNGETVSLAQYIKQQEQRSKSILKSMRSTLNNFLLGLTSYLLYKLLPCFLSGVVTHTEQIEMLKKAAERAPGIPLIFLPLHRSHLDYIMVTFILTNNNIRSPLVAAGNNLQIPVFGELLRGLGAFFIKRKIDPVVGKKDILYRAILELYLKHALKMGHNVEFFIEGGRTRTGKPCMPKGGILSVIVNAFMDSSIPDALLVPVSVNYERLVDGNFVREQKGEKKMPETFGKAISGIWKALNSKYGLMRIDFNQPYSLKELVRSYKNIAIEEGNKKTYSPANRTLQHNQSTSSLYGTDVVCEDQRALIDSISRQIVYDCAAATSVMSTNALAFLLLTHYRNGAPDFKVAAGLDSLRDMLRDRKDLGFSGNSMHIINYACDLLGTDLVRRSTNELGQVILKPADSIESFIELSYYSNMLAPHFAVNSLLLITFYSLLESPPVDFKKPNDKTVPAGTTRTKLLRTMLENCDVFRYEFILSKPTKTLELIINNALDEMLLQGFIKKTHKPELTGAELEALKWSKRIRQEFNDDSDDYDYNEDLEENKQPDLFQSNEQIEIQRAYCEVLAPFSHSYFAVAESLAKLYQQPMLETEFVTFVISQLSEKVKTGACAYAESISTDSVRNCLKVLEKWSVIHIGSQQGMRMLTLGADYENSKESLQSIVQRISAILPNYQNGYF